LRYILRSNLIKINTIFFFNNKCYKALKFILLHLFLDFTQKSNTIAMIEKINKFIRILLIYLMLMINFTACKEKSINYTVNDEKKSNIENSNNTDNFSTRNYIATKYIWPTVPILFLIIGTISNLISIIIFLRRDMRKYSSFVYFGILNIVNLALLYITCIRIILEFNFSIDIRDQSLFACKFHVFLTYFLGYISSLLLSMISIDRVISVALLRKAKEFCTPKIALVITSCLTLFMFLTTSHFLIFESAYFNDTIVICSPRPNTTYSKFIFHHWTLIDMCMFAFIPFIIMSISSIIILYTVSMQSRKMNIHNKNEFEVATFRRRSTTVAVNERKYKARTRNLALMLIPVNILFFAFLTPVVVTMHFYKRLDEDKLTSAIVELLAICNYTFNFLIYFSTSSKFREEFYKIFNEISFICQKNKSSARKFMTEVSNMKTIHNTVM
jgi:hypothetical protein